jgi:peptidyl-Lys metalloendopeptidase
MLIYKNLLSTLFLILIALSTLNAKNRLSVELILEHETSGLISVILTNPSTKDIKVLKWNTPLEDKLNANLFLVQNGKKAIPYRGRLLKRGTPKDTDYTIFSAGEKRTISIELPQYYKIIEKGDYTVSYKGSFRLKGISREKSILKKAKIINSILPFSFVPTEKKSLKTNKITTNFKGCSQSNIGKINNAYNAAKVMAKEASSVMNTAQQNTGGERYTTWFGASNSQRQTTVTSHFNNIYNALNVKNINYDCSTCLSEAQYDNTFAFVFPNEPYDIYLCGSFWTSEVTGSDSQAGTLIHELSHFTILAGTDDHVYGEDKAKQLAITTPEKTLNNADNHEYFAENTPHLTMESNNIFENAQQISNFPLSDNISTAGEKNVYKLIANKSAEYVLYTKDELDTIGVLYNSKFNIIKEADDISENNYNFSLYYNLIKGRTYYLVVSAYETTVGSYTLHSFSLSRGKSDFNGDTLADVLWRKGSGNYLWYMKPNGTHSYKNIGSKSTTYSISGTADFNYDGVSDILWRKGSGNYLWYMKPNGTHTYKNIGSKSSDYKIVGVADFNNDAFADILWRKGSGNYLWYMKKDGTHTYKNIGRKSTSYSVVGVADFNGDGTADILWRNGSGIYLWYMKPDGTHTYKNIGKVSIAYSISGIADFNADGIADILWRKGSGNYLWYMESDGKHSYKNIGSKSTLYSISNISDFNGDGIADILWRRDSGNYLWYMKPDGTHIYKNIGGKSSSFIVQ